MDEDLGFGFDVGFKVVEDVGFLEGILGIDGSSVEFVTMTSVRPIVMVLILHVISQNRTKSGF